MGLRNAETHFQAYWRGLYGWFSVNLLAFQCKASGCSEAQALWCQILLRLPWYNAQNSSRSQGAIFIAQIFANFICPNKDLPKSLLPKFSIFPLGCAHVQAVFCPRIILDISEILWGGYSCLWIVTTANTFVRN